MSPTCARRSPTFAQANMEVVLLKGAAFGRGAQVAASHTAAMASADEFVDVLTRESGVVRVETVREVAQAVSILSTVGRVRGNVAVVAESGGHAVLAADACERHGIPLAELSAQTTSDLRGIVAELGVVNPIDIRRSLAALNASDRFSRRSPGIQPSTASCCSTERMARRHGFRLRMASDRGGNDPRDASTGAGRAGRLDDDRRPPSAHGERRCRDPGR